MIQRVRRMMGSLGGSPILIFFFLVAVAVAVMIFFISVVEVFLSFFVVP